MTATTTTPTQQHDQQHHQLDHGRIIFGPMWYVGVVGIILISVIALFQEDRALVHLLPYRGNGRNGSSSGKSRSPTGDGIDVDILFPLTPSLFLDGSRMELDDGTSKTKKNYSSFLWHTGIGGNIRGSNFTGSNLNLFPRRDNTYPEHDASNSESKTRSSATPSKVATTRIQRIVVLGERHSGTTFVTQYLQDCFGNNGGDDSLEKNQQSTTSTSLKESRIERIVVSDRLVNTKHWFQPSPEYVVQTVLNDLFRTQQTKHPKNRKKKLSTSSTSSSINQLQSPLSSSSSALSSYTVGSNDDIDLQWWKEIVFGNNDDANDSSITSIEAMMEFDENLNNSTTTTRLFNQLLKETRKFFESTFVIVLVRDPYDWMEAVRRKPWHWPNHIDLFERTDTALERANGTSKSQSIQKSLIGYRLLDWEMFVSRQMRLAPELSNSAQTAICQKGLPKGYVSPCHRNKTYVPKSIPAKIPKSFLRNLPFDVNDPVYELNMATEGSQPYQHPLALRTAKLENMLAVPKHWYLAGFNVVPYESLDSGGLDKLTNDILSVYGTQNSNNSFTCPYGPHERSFTRQRSYNIPHGFRSWVNENSNWDIENLIGYQSQHRDNHEV